MDENEICEKKGSIHNRERKKGKSSALLIVLILIKAPIVS